MRRFTRSAIVLAVVLTVSLLVWRSLQPDDHAGPCAVVGGVVSLPELPESSGLAVSRRTPGVLWSHNDSGSAAVLFAIDTAGRVRGRVQIPVRAQDWEDISAASCSAGDCLYVADIGDNKLARRSLQIHRLPEPAAADGHASPPDTFTATYADGPHNAEALFVVGDDLFIVTRDRTGVVYRSTMTALSMTGSSVTGSSMTGSSMTLTFQRVGEMGLEAVSDAETSRDGTAVVVRTSHEAVLYRTADVIRGRYVAYQRIPIDGLKEPQGEGVALDDALLYLSSEGRPWNRAGRLLTLQCELPR